MSADFMTVDAAAGLLQLHPKTVLRHIREGRLRATRLGKQYRILRSDLHAFAGSSRPARVRAARATTIVDIADVDAALLHRLQAILIGASQGKDPSDAPMSLDIAHDVTRGSAKVIIVAAPDDAAMLLRLVGACLEG